MDTPDLRHPTHPDAPQNPLRQFRASTKRLKIHPLERAALVIVCIHLCALPWAIGGMRLWSQIPSLILATLGFIVALIPRNYTEEHTGANRFRPFSMLIGSQGQSVTAQSKRIVTAPVTPLNLHWRNR